MPETNNTHLQVQTKLPSHVRAGIHFSLGYNVLPLASVTTEMREKLEADPHLKLKEIDAARAKALTKFQGGNLIDPPAAPKADNAPQTVVATPQQVRLAVDSLGLAADEHAKVVDVNKALKDQGLKVTPVKAADIAAARELAEASPEQIAEALASIELEADQQPDIQLLNAALNSANVEAVATPAGLQAAISINQ